jgi:hypothetical protein
LIDAERAGGDQPVDPVEHCGHSRHVRADGVVVRGIDTALERADGTGGVYRKPERHTKPGIRGEAS